MDDLRLQALPARVAAWHNQHPFAHRISAAQVQAVGFVALPFVASNDKGSAGKLKPVFSENFIAPLSPKRIARWAARHGRVLAQAPAAGAVRHIDIDTQMNADRGADNATSRSTVYLMTAAIDIGSLRTRVLMGAGAPGAVLGPRLWSGPRLAAGAAAGLLCMLSLSWWSWQARQSAVLPAVAAAQVAVPHKVRAVAQAPVAPVASVAPVAAASSAASSAATFKAPVAVVEPTPSPVTPTAPVAVADVQAQQGQVSLPALPRWISDEAKAAARAERLAREKQQGSAVAAVGAAASAAVSAVTAPAAGVAAKVAANNAPRQTAFALTTRPLRTRAEAEQVLAAMSALLRSGTAGAAGKVQTDILPEGDDWRVIGMPFAQRDGAEQARKLLVARGLRVQVIAF